jgi:phage FluMu protein Com
MQYYHVRCQRCSTVLQTDIASIDKNVIIENTGKHLSLTCPNCKATDTYDSTKFFLLRNTSITI